LVIAGIPRPPTSLANWKLWKLSTALFVHCTLTKLDAQLTSQYCLIRVTDFLFEPFIRGNESGCGVARSDFKGALRNGRQVDSEGFETNPKGWVRIRRMTEVEFCNIVQHLSVRDGAYSVGIRFAGIHECLRSEEHTS